MSLRTYQTGNSILSRSRVMGHYRATVVGTRSDARALSSGASPTSKALCAALQQEKSYDAALSFFPSRKETSGLKSLFEPRSVAVVGATERAGSVGRTLVNNLLESRSQAQATYDIYPVNPTRSSVLGLPCYSSLEAIPGDVDMVVIVTPAKTCVDVMRQCAKKHVGAAVVISAGFREAGPEGVALEENLVAVARDAGIRVVGPNCVGVMNPVYGVNATFAATNGQPGRIAFISQSGAMCTSVLDWSFKEDIGFSAFVSVGAMADVNWGDLLDYLGDDPMTSAILMYMEGAGNAGAFLAAAKDVALKKPIIVIKAGKSEAAAAAAASHTGSLAGSYSSFEAAMRRVGVMTVDTIRQLFDCALVLAKQPRPTGPNLLIVTNAGGPAVLATDAAVASGAQPAPLSAHLKTKLDEFLPAAWSHGNPVDILGDASPETFQKTLETILLCDDSSSSSADGVLVILSPQDVTEPTETARALVQAVERVRQAGKASKPVLAAWMGGATVEEGARLLSQAGIPSFSNPDDAAATFGRLWKQAEALDVLYEPRTASSTTSADLGKSSRDEARSLLQRVRASNRSLLTEAESKQILSAYGIGVVPTVIATTPQEACHAAEQLHKERYAVKLHSTTLTHKADVGGVKLNVERDGIAEAFEDIRSAVESLHGLDHFQGVTVQPMIQLDKGLELILGSTVDPQFGPLVMFGSGGSMVEIFKDTALGVPPFNDNLTDMLMQKTRIYKALKGAQGKRFEGVNLAELRELINRFSAMVVDLSDFVAECDINPLLASHDGQFIALDARFALASGSVPPSVRPYPNDYVTQLRLPNLSESTVDVRPVRPTDWHAVESFYQRLPSTEARRRFLQNVSSEQRTSLETLVKTCYADYNRRLTLLATAPKSQSVVGVCDIERPPKTHLASSTAHARFAADETQAPGLTRALLENALQVARKEQLTQLIIYRLADDAEFTKFAHELGATAKPVEASQADNVVEYTFVL